MGMSASQIRYCMLQARKNDIEYQGQQINQQRTTLATQSAAHNTELLTLTVPTPPSTEQYTKVNYSFSKNGSDCTIKGITLNSDKTTYTVSYKTKEVKDVATQGATFTYITRKEKNAEGKEVDVKYVVLNGEEHKLLSAPTTGEGSATHSANLELIKKEFTEVKDDTFYYYEMNNGTISYAYFASSDLTTSGNRVKDYVVSAQQVDTPVTMKKANINWTDTGRIASITELKDDGSSLRTYALDMDTVTDNDAYKNAYNEYLYKKDQYNKTMDEINAKLDIIQAQDKELELQLRNLDTQEKAISTEMDAVKSVTDKNVEKSFNVFG